MDREGLRATQAPLKESYREHPETALVTLKAQAELGSETLSCSVATGQAMVQAGLHPASGGDGTMACSGEMLLQALVACAGVTLRSVATNRGVAMQGSVRAEGDLDFRGTMGVDRDAPVGFSAIRLIFEVESPASDEEVQAVLRATQRYCVVYQTLLSPPSVCAVRGETPDQV